MIRYLFSCLTVLYTSGAIAQTNGTTPAATGSVQPSPDSASSGAALPASSGAALSDPNSQMNTPPGARDAAPVPLAATAAAPPSGIVSAPPAATPSPVPEQTGPRPTPAGPLQIVTPNATVKFGFLIQPQYEAVGSASLDGMGQNLFVRRTRLLVGGTLFKYFDFFFDTDFANLFKAPNAAPGDPNPKLTPGMNIQDAFGTFKPISEFMVDVGYMLPPLSHNALQGATSLYSWDYFTNSFRHSNVFGSTADPIGRDAGVQLRGLIAKGVLEYRLGAFQGRRIEASPTEMASRNFFRVAGRLQLNLLDPETAFFYAGTYLGAKRILSFGISYDFQDAYKHASGDGFLDLPLGPGVLTAQANVSHWNGEDWVAMPNQTALMGEAGYLFDALNVSPIVRIEHRWVKNQTAAVPEETRLGGGLAFWPYGHNINVKAFYTHVSPDPGIHAYSQVNVQTQFFVF